MKILHIWDNAGIGSRISEYINSHGLGSSYVIKRDRFDRHQIESSYDFNIMVKGSKWKYTLCVIKELVFFRPDIIHVHSWKWGVLIARIFCPFSAIIITYHGTDIRGKNVPKFIKVCTSKILVSTRDLLTEGVEHYGYASG